MKNIRFFDISSNNKITICCYQTDLSWWTVMFSYRLIISINNRIFKPCIFRSWQHMIRGSLEQWWMISIGWWSELMAHVCCEIFMIQWKVWAQLSAQQYENGNRKKLCEYNISKRQTMRRDLWQFWELISCNKISNISW